MSWHPPVSSKQGAMVLAWRIQAIDPQRCPVEALLQLGQRDRLGRFVDLDRTQKPVLRETADQEIYDLADRRGGAPQINTSGFAERLAPRRGNERYQQL